MNMMTKIFSEMMFDCFLHCISSFWGKFGEKPNKTQTLTVASPRELYAIKRIMGTTFTIYEFALKIS